MATLIVLIACLLFALQFKAVQTFFAQRAAQYLSSQLHTRVEIKGLYIKPFKSLVLEGFYVQDLGKDTLLYSPQLTVDIKSLSIEKRKVLINKIYLEGSKIYLKKYKDQTTNLAFIINYFNSGTKKTSEPFNVFFNRIILNNIAFKYKNFSDTSKTNGINFEDISLSHLSVSISDLETKNHLAKAQLSNLTFREKSGFYLKNLSALTTIDKNQMEFKNLLLETNQTRMGNYFLMKYDSFKDFDSFVSKVYMNAHFKNTHIYARDIAYFVPELSKVDVDIQLSGSAKGKVNDLQAKALSIKTGKTTYLNGDFDIKGLPVLKEAFLDLNLNQAFVNKQDLDYIIEKITGKKDKLVPPIINKFGDINFKGRFTGFINDFIAFGEFKTKLGRIASDVNMKIDTKGEPSYSGVIKVYDFDLGNLLDQDKLGRISAVANVTGQGFSLAHLREKAKGQIAYLDFNGYRYYNIILDGNYENKEFLGQLHIDDKNLKLSFSGKVNLNPQLPIFDFNATIQDANLKELNFSKDTISIGAELKTNFSGTNLDNIQGALGVYKATLTNSRQAMVIDSIALIATGTGNNRSLSIRSDILDASINGAYDLNTLPSYFISVVKKYIPSLQTKTVSSKPQNFDLALRLKNFEPVRIFFAPNIKIPYGATLNGKFSSVNNVAILSAYSKLIQYNRVKINNLIIDQNTSPSELAIFVTSDRVDFTDSLFVKNINIANTLRNDSLNFNIKLSDKNATNQLDLNGLVEFNTNTDTDSKVKLSLLPSDVIINHETWKIQEKVYFNFDKGKTIVNNLGLSFNNQLVTVQGIISSDPSDELVIGFKKFQLKSLTPLTKGEGIYLSGELNGEARLSNLKNQPNLQSNLKIDSIACNGVYLGNLFLETGLDNVNKLIAVKAEISKQGRQTVHIVGTYNMDKNDLNTDVHLDKSSIIVLQPFLLHLVSNLSGEVSANLKVTGQLSKPQINGTLNLEGVGLTVNYLKTHYHISNSLLIKDNVIHLSNFVLKDKYNHEAIAKEGTVDLSSLNNPDINVNLKAKQFMVLNTTKKDNSLYYGSAFGTGTFEFKGPVDNMSIKINAKTEPGTIFNIPLNSSEKVSENDFITFVKKDSTLIDKKEFRYNGLTMNFDLELTDDSEVNIYTSLGNLSGRGNSSLNLKINSFGDFNIFGNYQITQGKFHYNAANVINKIFEITPGGSIRWTGSPTGAIIALSAIYSVRANIKPLYLAAGKDPKDQRVVAEAVMNLNGYLLKPDISFQINFPNDSYVSDDLQSYLSDINNTTQQAFSLIVQRSFIALSGGTTNQANDPNRSNAGTAGGKIATEAAINKATDILANTLNLQFVDFNIRPSEDYSASLRLWNDRLIITGMYTDRAGDIQTSTTVTSALAGDIRYLIKKDGSFAATASNKPPQISIVDPTNTQNISALGLIYTREFDGFGDLKLIKMIIGTKRKEERQKQKQAGPKN